MNPQLEINPYQQNVDIIKNFFRKPIILVTAIVMAICNIVAMIPLPYQAQLIRSYISRLPSDTIDSFNQLGLDTAEISGGQVSLLGILLTVTFFLFYFFSRSERYSLKAPTTMFKVYAVIQLVVICIITALSILLFLIVMGISLSVGNKEKFLLPVFLCILFALLVVMGIILWYVIMQFRYANSIKKSTSTIYLYKNGAKAFGIFSSICCGISIIGLIAAISNGTIPRILGWDALAVYVLQLVQTALISIVAIMYANYIKDVSLNIQTQPAYAPVQPEATFDPYGNVQPIAPQQNYAAIPTAQPTEQPVPYAQQPVEPTAQSETPAPKFCSNCGNPLGADDYFCNNCGTKVK